MTRMMDASTIEWISRAAATRKLNLGGTTEAFVRKRDVNWSALGRCACGPSVERVELLRRGLRFFRNQIPFDDV